MRLIILSLLGLGLGAPLVWLYVETGFISVVGVDVSHHQKAIDWPALARSGVAFAYIKATEGGDYVDDRFAANWRAAQAAGMPRGAYHYFRQCRPGELQARNFIAAVPRDAGSLPPVVDAEDMETCPAEAGVGRPETELAKFLDLLAAHYGCRPLISTTLEYERAFLSGKFAQDRFWVRSIFMPPVFRTGSWALWQFHNAGRRPGVETRIDLNAFRGTTAEFQRFATGEGCARR